MSTKEMAANNSLSMCQKQCHANYYCYKVQLSILAFVMVMIALLPLPIVGHGRPFSGEDESEIVTSKYLMGGPVHDIYWGLTDERKAKTCILMSGMLSIFIPYVTDLYQRGMAAIPVPRNASVFGTCGDHSASVQTMTLSWFPPSPTQESQPHNLSFTFTRFKTEVHSPHFYSFLIDLFLSHLSTVDGDDYFKLTSVTADVQANEDEFPNAMNPGHIYRLKTSNLKDMMTTRQKQSYYCQTNQFLPFDEPETSLGINLLHVEAFHESLALGDGSDFGPRSFCTRDGFEVILTVFLYVLILAVLALIIFYLIDGNKRAKYGYTYL